MNGRALPPNSRVRLSRQDLMRYEQELKDALAEFITFKSYTIYFPGRRQGPIAEGNFDPTKGEALYLKDQKQVFVPLIMHGQLLGVFLAKDARLPAPKTFPRFLPAIARLCLENLLLYKASISDHVTGLYNSNHCLETLSRQIRRIQDCVLPTTGACMDPTLANVNGQCSVAVVDVDYFKTITERFGFTFGDQVMAELGEVLRANRPEQVLACRHGDDGFALVWPDGTAREMTKLVDKLRRRIEKTEVLHEPRQERINLTVSIGTAAFPTDLRGPQIILPAREMARTLLRKAEKAMTIAKEQGRNTCFAFSDIIEQGGSVLETLPLNRISVNLGRSADAQEGQRFLIWSADFLREAQVRITDGRRLLGQYPTMYKGECVLMEVQDDMAFAEILHLHDPAWPIEASDRLTFIADAESGDDHLHHSESSPQKDMLTGLYPYRDFQSALAQERNRADEYCVSLVRLNPDLARRKGGYQKHVDGLIKKTAGLVQDIFAEDIDNKEIIGGRYSLNSLCFFIPDVHPETQQIRFAEAAMQAQDLYGAQLAIGVAAYPYLSFAKPDTLDNSRKALDHALLLNDPQVALFDTISLNISADRLFTQGDVYAAVEEYKLSLLADDNNNLSRNSLAVCFARLGKMEQAASTFSEVIKRDASDLMAQYNYGYACLRLKDYSQAEKAFKKCLNLQENHIFSLIRLGQLAEHQGRTKRARNFYEKAAAMPEGLSITSRHLARLSLGEGKIDHAREFLHQAISHNAADHQSIFLLARLYLEAGEDPQIAETLARQCTEIKPRNKSYWKLFAKALEADGQTEAAAQAKAKAEAL